MTKQDIFTANLKRLRMAAGFTMGELDRRALLNRGSVSKYERGERGAGPVSMKQLCVALDCSHDDLTRLHKP